MVIYGPALNHRTVLVDSDLLRLSEVGNLYVFQLGVVTFPYGFAAGQQSDVLQPTLALITQLRSADGRNFQDRKIVGERRLDQKSVV